jgi:endonuclease YncB( thermonuclease family)
MSPMRTWLLVIAAFAPLAAAADSFRGVVSHITDGDTVWVRPAGGGPAQQVRIDGIDAPEICQAFGPESRDALAAHLLHRHVVVLTRAEDDYHRTVARLHLGRADVGRWMVLHGYAWSYRFRGDLGPYHHEEAKARTQRLGLWHDREPETPRDFRVRHGSCH